MNTFLVRCPKCKNQMKCHYPDPNILKKRKQCVYCPKSFKVRDNLTKDSNKEPEIIAYGAFTDGLKPKNS
ncbi:MAG: hypothetical protein O2779_02430 [Nanoarchaeota archaeon]|nr:hypothetical protein [Nanoarchaeota archaeon]